MGSVAPGPGHEYDSYLLLVGLWAGENPLKTAKFLALLGVNALLVTGLSLAGGLIPENWPLCLAGAGFSLLLVLSLGRTVLFQEAWRMKIRGLAARNPGDERFQVLETAGERERAPVLVRMLGSVPSGYYLLGAPVLLFLCWATALVLILI
jgi:hypothetical protein